MARRHARYSPRRRVEGHGEKMAFANHETLLELAPHGSTPLASSDNQQCVSLRKLAM